MNVQVAKQAPAGKRTADADSKRVLITTQPPFLRPPHYTDALRPQGPPKLCDEASTPTPAWVRVQRVCVKNGANTSSPHEAAGDCEGRGSRGWASIEGAGASRGRKWLRGLRTKVRVCAREGGGRGRVQGGKRARECAAAHLVPKVLLQQHVLLDARHHVRFLHTLLVHLHVALPLRRGLPRVPCRSRETKKTQSECGCVHV